MKAAILKCANKLCIEEMDLGRPRPDEVIIDVKACGICGTDVHLYHGGGGSLDAVYPIVLGHEYSGVIREVGAAVDTLAPGDKVAVNPNDMCGHCYYCRTEKPAFCDNHIGIGTNWHGAFAQQAKARARVVHKFSRADFVQASMIEPLSCCLNVFRQCPVSCGDTWLIVGAGPIGMMMMLLARLSGASFIAMAETVEEKRRKSLTLGADAAFSPLERKAPSLAASLGIRRFSRIVDCVGLVSTQEYCLEAAGKGSDVVFFGLGGHDDKVQINPMRLFRNQITLYSSFINPMTFEQTVEIVESGRLDLSTLVSATIPLEDLEEALSSDRLRRTGKVVVVF